MRASEIRPGWFGHFGQDERRVADTLRAICLTMVVASGATLVVSILFDPTTPPLTDMIFVGVVMAFFLGILRWVQRGRLRAASVALVLVSFTATSLGLLAAGGLQTPGFSFYAVGIVAAGLLLGGVAAVAYALAAAAASAAIGALEVAGLLSPLVTYRPFSIWWIEMLLFGTTAAFVFVSVRRIRDAFEDSRRSATSLAERNRELTRILEAKELTEKRLREAEKLEALGRLSGSVAHDFNNLLGVIRGFAQILEDRAGEDPGLAKPAGHILSATRRASDLADQLMAFGSRRAEVTERVDINQVTGEVASMLEHLLPHGIELSLELCDGPAWVEIAPGHVHQILLNLVSNAADAMPDGGRIRIVTAGEEKRVVLSVHDEGTGMDAETADRIFEPFFTTKAEGGTGLGLTSVQGLVGQCGGSIDFLTHPQAGTTFRVAVPRSPA